MIRYLFFFLGIFISTNAAMAQSPATGWIDIKSSIKNSFQHKVIGADMQGYYLYQSSGKERVIEKHSYTNNLIYSHKIPLEDRNIEIEDLIIRQEDVVVFFSIYSTQLRKHGLFYLVLPHSGEPGKPVIMLDMEGILNRNRSFFHITSNDDLSGFSCVHQYQDRMDELQLEVYFFDAMIRKITNTRLLIPQAQERLNIRKFVHDNDFNLYVLVEGIDKSRKNNDPEKHYYKVIRIHRFNLQADELKLGSSIYFLNAIQIATDRENNRIKMAGFYATNERGLVAGTIIASINPATMYFDTIGYTRFDLEFAQKLTALKQTKKEKELTDYQIKDLIVRSDGGVVIVAESNYQTNQTYVQYSQGFPIYREIVYYHYDEVVLVSINPEGSIDWRQIVPKTQMTVTPSPYNSFVHFGCGSFIYIIFNEEGRSKSSVVSYAVDHSGGVIPRTVLSNEISEATIIPTDARIITPTTLLIPADKRKKKGIFRLTFDGI